MDKYSKIKKIGEGSFGKALLVRSKSDNTQYVVKEINMSKMSKKERDEARKEVSVLAQLNHANIVTYRESFEEVGNLYIVMDYCEAGDLYSQINAQRGVLINEDKILDWFVQISLSIKHIHDRKILHRDIKSQNIFLTRHGIVKLGDFGIAKVLNSTIELARTCIGTPYYLSPEICENKPYNNKSDIWSLGCVLYEMATLKHAFEAGNMKNLVLKIIRGSYPPISSRYSYEMRNLVAHLFKRNPRDRPSINSVLRKPLLQKRIQRFLSESEIADEFSHTVMHGVKLKKALPAGAPRPLPAQPVKKKPVSAPSPRYDPSLIYGMPSARKSKENAKVVRKSSENVRKSSENKRQGLEDQEFIRKRQELIEKEKMRREAARKKEIQYNKQHKNLVDKQRMARINEAREAGWKSVLEGQYNEQEAKKRNQSPSRDIKSPATPVARVQPMVVPRPVSARENRPSQPPGPAGQYEQYHAWLDQQQQKRERDAVMNRAAPVDVYNRAANIAQHAPSVAASVNVTSAGPAGVYNAPPVFGAFNPVQAAIAGQEAGQQGLLAAERARLVKEYQQRKQVAAHNKARAHGDNICVRAHGDNICGIKPAQKPAVPAATPITRVQNNSEEEYLARLKQIRLQNFNERRAIQERNPIINKAPSNNERQIADENRRLKIEALRQQAEDRAKLLKNDLERRRFDANIERNQKAAKPSVRAVPFEPVPALPLTKVMQEIGAVQKLAPQKPLNQDLEIENSCQVRVSLSEESYSNDQSKSPIQKKKASILKKLNAKERPKWDRKNDDEKSNFVDKNVPPLSQMSLEETASHMEETSSEDLVIQHPEISKKGDNESVQSSRKHWGGPPGTVLNALKGAQILETGSILLDTGSDGQGDNISDEDKGRSLNFSEQPSDKKEAVKPDKMQSRYDTYTKLTSNIIAVNQSENVLVKDLKSRNNVNDDTKDTEVFSSPSLVVRSLSDQINSDAKDDGKSFDKMKQEQFFTKLEVDKQLPVVENLEVIKVEELESDEENSAKTQLKEEPKLNTNLLDRNKKDTSFQEGLQTGCFDISDVKLLRTCSEPDLAKLFRTAPTNNAFFFENNEGISASVDVSALNTNNTLVGDLNEANLAKNNEELVMEDEDDDNNHDELEPGEIVVLSAEEESDSENQPASQYSEFLGMVEKLSSSDTEQSSEDDMESMRQSMLELLSNKDTSDNETCTKQETSKKKKKRGFLKKYASDKVSETKDLSYEEKIKEEKQNEIAHKEYKSLTETMKAVLTPPSKDKQKTSPLKEEESPALKCDKIDSATESALNLNTDTELWQSDSDSEEFGDDNMFSRLEESREKLEKELGCDVFLKAYKTVQAIHEDEDDNMETGLKLVCDILGPGKQHLYPSILQLVMADGAFLEDNL